jgi:hypothetical protein
MKNVLLASLFLTYQFPVFAQSLEWAYSFKNQTVQEDVTDVSSNGSNRFAIIGTGNSGISMDPINLSSTYNSLGNFVAGYNELAQIQWIQPTQGNAFGVKVASNGDVFVVGGFTGTKDFDPSSNSFPLTANGYDTYLQKFNADGTFAWAAKASAEGNPSLIEILADGRIIVAGRSDVDATVTLSNSSTVSLLKGAYLLEFSSAGSFTNAYSISVPAAAGYIYVYDVTSDANNNIYLAGSLDGIADFDLSGGISNNTATNAYDAYVVKYNSTFDLQWFRKFGDSNNPTGWDKARALAIDASGNVFAAGEFTWTTDFDPSNPGTVTLVSDPASQVPSGFVLQWSSSGVLNWVKKIGNTNSGAATDFASVSVLDIILQNNVLYTAMEGHGYWDVDPSAGSVILNVGAVSSPGIVFAKYSDAGNYIGAFSIDTSEASAGLNSVGIGMLGADKFVTAGTFSKRIDFDPTPNNFYLQTDVTGSFYNFDKDLYIAKYNFGVSTSLNEVSDNRVLIYPNPFNNIVHFNSDKTVEVANIYNNLGQLLCSKEKPNGFINTSDLADGFYLLEIKFEDNTTVRNTIIK